jgi:hypothetical protein
MRDHSEHAPPSTQSDGRKLWKIVIINDSKTSQDNEVSPDEVFESLMSPNFSAVRSVDGSAKPSCTDDSFHYRLRPNNSLKQTFG